MRNPVILGISAVLGLQTHDVLPTELPCGDFSLLIYIYLSSLHLCHVRDPIHFQRAGASSLDLNSLIPLALPRKVSGASNGRVVSLVSSTLKASSRRRVSQVVILLLASRHELV